MNAVCEIQIVEIEFDGRGAPNIREREKYFREKENVIELLFLSRVIFPAIYFTETLERTI